MPKRESAEPIPKREPQRAVVARQPETETRRYPPGFQDELTKVLAKNVNARAETGTAVIDGEPDTAPPPTTRQQNVQLLYSDDHARRAVALDAELPEMRAGLIDSTPPTAIPGLQTLTFWGHGDQAQLCHLKPNEMVKLIKQWKKLNPSLSTIELLTCNARHYKPEEGKGDSFANKLKSGLRAGVRSSTRNLTVKALPKAVTGKKNAWSILLADPNSNSWVYVVAPGATDDLMMQAQNLIRYEKTPSGGSKSFNGDIAARANKVIAEHPDRQWSMVYGYFRDLRRVLGVV